MPPDPLPFLFIAIGVLMTGIGIVTLNERNPDDAQQLFVMGAICTAVGAAIFFLS